MDEAIVRSSEVEEPWRDEYKSQFHIDFGGPYPMLSRRYTPSDAEESPIVPSPPAQTVEVIVEMADSQKFYQEEEELIKPSSYADAVKRRPKNRNRRRRRSSDQMQTKNICITAEPRIVLPQDSNECVKSDAMNQKYALIKEDTGTQSLPAQIEETVEEIISAELDAVEERKSISDTSEFEEIGFISKTPSEAAISEEPSNDVADAEEDSADDSDEWNYVPGRRDKNKKHQVEEVASDRAESQNEIDVDDKKVDQPELKDDRLEDEKDDHVQDRKTDDEEDDMSQLNPDAKEFVPVFGAADLDVEISSSPRKGAERSLDGVAVPAQQEFFDEIATKPSDLEGIDLDSSVNYARALNGFDVSAGSTQVQFDVDSDKENCEDEVEEATRTPSSNPFAEDVQPETVGNYFSEQPSLGFKPFDPMQASMVVLDSPTDDFYGNASKPDLLSPMEDLGQVTANSEQLNSSSGFESENSNEIDLGSHGKCDLVAGIPEMKIDQEEAPVDQEVQKSLVDMSETNPFNLDNAVSQETPVQPSFDFGLPSTEEPFDPVRNTEDDQTFSNNFDSVESQDVGFARENINTEKVEMMDLISNLENAANEDLLNVDVTPEIVQQVNIEKGSVDEFEKEEHLEKEPEDANFLGLPEDKTKEDSAENSFEIINPEEEAPFDSHAMNGSIRGDNDLPLDGHDQKIHQDLVQETVEIDVEPPRNFQPDFLARDDFLKEEDEVPAPAKLQMEDDFFSENHQDADTLAEIREIPLVTQPEPTPLYKDEEIGTPHADIKSEITTEDPVVEDVFSKSAIDDQFAHIDGIHEEIVQRPVETIASSDDFFAKDDIEQLDEPKESMSAIPSAPLSEDVVPAEVISPIQESPVEVAEPVELAESAAAVEVPCEVAQEVTADFSKQNGEIPEASTPPTTPAPGLVDMDGKDKLIAAAAGVATVAAAAAAIATLDAKPAKTDPVKKPTTTKTDAKSPTKPAAKTTAKPSPASATAKKPTTTSTTAKAPISAKPSAAPKAPAAAKPAATKTTTTTKPAPITKPAAAKPASATAAKPTATAKASAPAKVAPAKPATAPTARAAPPAAAKTAPLKPKAPVTAAPIKKTTAAPTASKPASSLAAAAKKPETAKPAPKAAPITRPSSAAKPISAAPKPTSTTAAKPAAAKPSAAAKPAAPRPASTVGAKPAVGAAKPAPKPLTKPAAAKPAAPAAKAPLKSAPATKPVAGKTTPTAVKKPASAPAKPAVGAAKSPIKKPTDVKKPVEKEAAAVTKDDITADLVNQEPVVSTTTNGHVDVMENGVGHSEESSPIDVHHPMAFEAHN